VSEVAPAVPGDLGASAKALRRRLATFRPTGAAPDWLPSTLLQHIVSLPAARRAWHKGLARSAQRTVLIRAGVGLRREFDASSQTARALAGLVRRDPVLWDVAVQATFAHYDGPKRPFPDEDLVALARDPAAYVDEHPACPAEFVVTTAYALAAADEDELALVADEVAQRLNGRDGAGQAEIDEDAERHRIQALEDLVKALEKDLKDRDKRLRAAEREAHELRDSLLGLQGVERRAGDVGEQLAEARAKSAADAQTIALLRGELAASRADQERLGEAEARAAEVDSLRTDLEELRSERDRERNLRREAQEEADGVAEQLRALARARPAVPSDAPETLGVESPSALFGALAPVVGRATALAAERLGAGSPLPDDPHLLRLTALFSELRQLVNAPAPEEPVAAEEPAPPAEPAPAEEPPRALPSTRVRRGRTIAQPFRVRALGGAEEIGGSALLVQTNNGHSVLLDAGQRVKGEYGDPAAQPFHFRVPADTLDAVLVTHAHIDHVGSLPTILGAVEAATDHEVPVLMTAPTRRLAEIMLHDSARIQAAREQRLGAAELGHSDYPEGSMRAAYTRSDVDELIGRVKIAERGAKLRIGDTSLLVRYLPVPHVLGSCAIHLTEEESGFTLLYTGDLGPVSDPQATLPHWGFDELEPADVVIMESTYGSPDAAHVEGRRRLHGRERAMQLLIDCAGRTVGQGGFLLLPSFGLGRAQELIKVIDAHRGREMPDGPLYVAGIGNRVMDVYDEYSQTRNGGWGTVGSFPSVRDPNEWLRPGGSFDEAVLEILHGEEPGYVIASPAMLSGGWSRAFLREVVGDKRSGVVFTGYVPRTAGGIPGISRLATTDQLRLGDETRRVECLWKRIGLSAHAPTRDLHAFAERMTRGRDRVAFGVMHGEPAAQRELANWISDTLLDKGAAAQSLQRQTPWAPDVGG
jgi:Cft2 family RNA processing exonuclease